MIIVLTNVPWVLKPANNNILFVNLPHPGNINMKLQLTEQSSHYMHMV